MLSFEFVPLALGRAFDGGLRAAFTAPSGVEEGVMLVALGASADERRVGRRVDCDGETGCAKSLCSVSGISRGG